MQFLILVLIAGAAHAAPLDLKKLRADCYDANSGKACLELSQKLALSAKADDHARGKLARQRACTLGESAACTSRPAASPGASARAPEERNEKMTFKRSEVETELSNLPELLQAARLEARNQGFEFTQIEPKSAYERLGFRVGDILLEINGHALESSTQAMELFVLLRSESDFKVKLKRAGQTIMREYAVKE